MLTHVMFAGEEFGKMIAEQCKALKDQTGHVQLPLDLAKLTKDRLEKKAKQRQRRSNSAAPEGLRLYTV